ncbi:hypothetical protein LSTR_LSTR017100 [Laodelphax striatellus]|uniref:Uncharacterized protein n=1 Tax=Laodelphax striatellus TaxID=195883 RepID=A0A482WTV0_LAOST|nr:hypothetical protein LSTR_LSTR017100 [Laodelphax striatellus]
MVPHTECEDRLASHDAIGAAARDPKALERIKSLREETNALRKPLAVLRKSADDLVSEAAEVGVSDASHLRDEVDAIGERLDDLQGRLDDRCSRLQSAATAVSQFNDLVKTLVVDLNSLENELDTMKPPGRDLKTVRTQQDDLSRLVAKISRAGDEVNRAVNAGEHLVDSGNNQFMTVVFSNY